MRQLADTHLYGNKNQANKLNAGFVNVYDIFSIDNSITDLDNLCGNRYLKNTFKSKFKQCKLKVSFVSRDQAHSILLANDFVIVLFLQKLLTLTDIARIISI